jgi:hypothetical protein
MTVKPPSHPPDKNKPAAKLDHSQKIIRSFVHHLGALNLGALKPPPQSPSSAKRPS